MTVAPSFSTVLDRAAQRLASDLAEVREMMSHSGSKGTALEDSVAGLVERFLPDHVLVTSGFAVGPTGELSPQQDVLVVINDRIGPLATYGGFGVFPIENVIASIEVKANLTVTELQGALDSLRSFRRLAPATPGRSSVSSEPGNLLRQDIPVCGPFTAVFAFEGTGLSAGRILHECQQHQASGTIGDRINGVHVLGHSGTMRVDRTDTQHPALTIDPQARDLPDLKKWEGRPLELATNMVSGGDGLRLFIATLLGFVNWYKPPELNLNERMLRGISLPFDAEPRAPDADSGDT